MCGRWACSRQQLTAASWSGDATSCAAGKVDEEARERALRLVNAYRFLAGVHEVEAEPRWEEPAQQCALIAHANRRLSHTPPRDWSCWSDPGARASAVSLIANRSAPLAVDPFIEDPGNETTMAHRRWLLSEKIHRVALGSTTGYCCALVDGRQFDQRGAEGEPVTPAPDPEGAGDEVTARTAPRDWVAWPPPGPVPIDALRKTKIDATGWTVQSSNLDLDGAMVDVKVAGARRRVKVFGLERTLGSLTAIRFVPDGWSTEVGERYDVRVRKPGFAIEYAVEPIRCP